MVFFFRLGILVAIGFLFRLASGPDTIKIVLLFSPGSSSLTTVATDSDEDV